MRHSRIHLLFSVFVIVAATLLLSAGNASAQSTFTCGKWNHVSDSVGGMGQSLYGVAGSSANDVWAVGRRNPIKNPNYYVPLMQHWNGTSWSTVKLPATPQDTELYDVAAISSTDAWAVGYGYTAGALTFHWDGTQWNTIHDPYPKNHVGGLDAVTTLPNNQGIRAVGSTSDDNNIDKLITEYYC